MNAKEKEANNDDVVTPNVQENDDLNFENEAFGNNVDVGDGQTDNVQDNVMENDTPNLVREDPPETPIQTHPTYRKSKLLTNFLTHSHITLAQY